MSVILLSVGGACGAVFRYILGLFFSKKISAPFPIAMLLVNVLGSFGLGVSYRLIPNHTYEDLVFMTIAVGFFGAFTTFSTFSMEAVLLLRAKRWLACVAYVTLTIIGSVVMFAVGFGRT